tara:strand:+ start:2408 stop:2611 length:204 start_codon:yes stop_codon:yes gene_type:complete
MSNCKEPLHNHHDGCPSCFYSLNAESIIWEESERKYSGKPVGVFNAIRKYQMESPIFRLFVKLGLRK